MSTAPFSPKTAGALYLLAIAGGALLGAAWPVALGGAVVALYAAGTTALAQRHAQLDNATLEALRREVDTLREKTNALAIRRS